MSSPNPPKVFRLGIAMAGAVSAGAYTAGVMDYLLETLQRWQEAKAHNRELGPEHPDYDHSVPMHDVVIEVIGGASAGGMTAAISTVAMHEGIRLDISDPNQKKLYDTWVNLNDRGHEQPTLEQMLTLSDILENEEVPSLLNSRPIDAIAERAIALNSFTDLPPYISPDLEVILTITSLRGIPLEVNFYDNLPPQTRSVTDRAPIPAHRMYIHKGVAHFKMATNGQSTPAHTVPFDPRRAEHRDLMQQCAKATGAFPIGLKARLLEGIQPGYLKAMIYRMFNLDPLQDRKDMPGLDIEVGNGAFAFMAVDGGTINNEPFGEIIRALEEGYSASKTEKKVADYAIIMIDPFPNFDVGEEDPAVKHPSNVLELVPSIIGAIRGQAMVKEREIVRGLSSDHTRKMIFPKRENDPYPIACGSLDGFGGFFSRAFRECDYQLGRKNCQSFLRKHLCLLLEDAPHSPLFQDWTQDDSDPRHQRFFIPEKGEKGAYPIIPDLLVTHFAAGRYAEPELQEPPKPQIDAQDIFKLKPLIEERLKTVFRYIYKTDQKTIKAQDSETLKRVRKLMSAHYRQGKGLIGRLIPWAYRRILAPQAAKILTKKVIGEILLDFDKRGLLK